MVVASFHNTAPDRLDGGTVMQIFEDVAAELATAVAVHAPMASAHEGWAVIKEEEEELWDEIKAKHPDLAAMEREAVQVAAMAVRFLHDVIRNGSQK